MFNSHVIQQKSHKLIPSISFQILHCVKGGEVDQHQKGSMHGQFQELPVSDFVNILTVKS